MSVTIDGFGVLIGFIEFLQNATTSDYSAIANSHTAVHYSMYKIRSVS
jgi:hypothetical protein